MLCTIRDNESRSCEVNIPSGLELRLSCGGPATPREEGTGDPCCAYKIWEIGE